MKNKLRIALAFIVAASVVGSLAARPKVRKLPPSAYLKSAKIEILTGDPERYKVAVALLDSLFMHYGPHSEGLALMGMIMVDGMEKVTNPMDKAPYVVKMVAYTDSLHMCCDNKKIKKKFRKDCDKLTGLADSTRVKYWREFYNLGIEQLNYVQELAAELESETDSSARAFSVATRDSNIDSCIANFNLSILINPADYQPYVATGNAYEYKKDFPAAIDWLSRGLDMVSDREKLLLPIAYDHIRLEQYCDAIPFLKEYVGIVTTDLTVMGHLSKCYNNCQMYDSAAAVYQSILEQDPENTEVLTGVGRFFNQIARNASDSGRVARKDVDDTKTEYWQKKQHEAIDSSIVYFRKVYELKPNDIFAAEEYGMVSAIRGNYEDAVVAFTTLTELDPDNVDNWTTLGDCYLYLKDFVKAIPAYEKVVALDPTNRATWERLRDLYVETRQKDKQAEAEKRISEL